MKETLKCSHFRRQRGDFANYLHGDGIDIGSGDDLLQVDQGTVRPWDMEHGDAELLQSVPDNHFDFAYSSHCLEHMRDVGNALSNWIRILKPGGHLYFVVPDYVLYEKMMWPSRYNADHKFSFSFLLARGAVRRENHFNVQADLIPLLNRLGVDVVQWYVEDYGFDYNNGVVDQTRGMALSQICIIGRKRVSSASP